MLEEIAELRAVVAQQSKPVGWMDESGNIMSQAVKENLAKIQPWNAKTFRIPLVAASPSAEV